MLSRRLNLMKKGKPQEIIDKSNKIRTPLAVSDKNRAITKMIKNRFKRTRRLLSNCKEKRKNNLRDLFYCIITLISRVKESKYKIGNNQEGKLRSRLLVILK
jgi:hypothetical protein